MKCIYFFVLIVIITTHGFVVENIKERSERKISAPVLKLLNFKVEPDLEVIWTSVDDEHVIGYKLKLWVIGKNVTREERIKRLLSTTLYQNPPNIEVVTPANRTRALVSGIQPDTSYSIRVCAFTDKI